MKFEKLLVIIFFLTITPLFGQDLSSQLQKADSLFKAEEFFDAITEYKRFLFFNDNVQLEYIPNFQIGLSYKAGAKFDESIRYLTLASIKANNNEDKFQSLVNLARVNILRRTCQQAHRILDELLKTEQYISKKEELIYWKGFAYIFEDKWLEASDQFALLEGKSELVTICRNVDNEKVSVTLARVISYVLPGSGQIYAGEYLSGMISLAWNVFLGYHTINAAVNERIFDSLVVGNLLWLRFYRGNIQNAEQFAIQKNIRIANRTLDYLQTKYEGPKP